MTRSFKDYQTSYSIYKDDQEDEGKPSSLTFEGWLVEQLQKQEESVKKQNVLISCVKLLLPKADKDVRTVVSAAIEKIEELAGLIDDD